MKQGRGIGLEIASRKVNKISPTRRTSVQRPRVFYRRELEGNPLSSPNREGDRRAEPRVSLDPAALRTVLRYYL